MFITLFIFRFGFVIYRKNFNTFKLSKLKNNQTIIIGAGEATKIYLQNNNNQNFDIVGIFDDNNKLRNKFINGIKVIGSINEIIFFLNSNNIKNIIYLIPSIDSEIHKDTLKEISNKYPKIMIYSSPSLNDIQEGLKPIYELNLLNDFLFSKNQDVFINKNDSKYLNNKIIFITGIAGSIGESLAENILSLNDSKQIIGLDNSEYGIYKLTDKFSNQISEGKIKLYLGDYGDQKLIKSIINKNKINLIYHAAAYKHVNILESNNIYSAIKNNCLNSIKLANTIKDLASVKKFTLISTDKAVYPSNIMGLSKRLVELLLDNIFKDGKVDFITVRFGNVIGSKGSVFHKFLYQINNKQKITLTDKNVKRYFMNIATATKLVIKSSIIGKNREIYILNMGKPVKIYDLILNLIDKFGNKSQVNDIEITGLQEGEKIDEELNYNFEKLNKIDKQIYFTKHKFIELNALDFKNKLEKIDITDEDKIKKLIKSFKII